MKIYFSTLFCLACVLSGPVLAQATNSADASSSATIIVIDSMEPGQSFNVARTDLVRIPATVVAGSSIVSKVAGPAELAAHNRIVPMKENTGPDGEKTLEPLLGVSEHEFLIRPTSAARSL